jgi:hypothetical protein
MITDKESYEDFRRFRDDCKSLQFFVREMFEVGRCKMKRCNLCRTCLKLCALN